MMKAIKKPKQNQKKKNNNNKNSTLFANSMKTTDVQYDRKPTFDETLLQATFVPLC